MITPLNSMNTLFYNGVSVCFLCGTNGIWRTFLLSGLKYDNEILNRLNSPPACLPNQLSQADLDVDFVFPGVKYWYDRNADLQLRRSFNQEAISNNSN